ncbi:MAG TPA: glycosyltransferase family 4 protein [Candidatus Eisenbacteria bacterium]|nr:glycosyltransferase family 4 protein [Candidatus Eisenbacteria bacterium]
MNVLALNWRDARHPEAGGAEVHLYEILARWVKRGATVTVVASGFPGAAPEDEQNGMRILRRGSWWNGNWAAAQCVKQELAGEPFDLVVEDLNKLPYFSPLYAKAPVLTIVPHLFGTTAFAEASWPVAAAVWAHERLIPAIYRDSPFLAISESTRQDLVARGIARERISVSVCGLDHERYRPGGEKTAHPSVLYVGRLRRYKGVDALLDAFVRVRERLPEARLTVLGDGPHRTTLERRAAALQLGDNVTFTGFVPSAEKVQKLQSAWVSALPSPKEGWGLTVVESNACGTPVVASRSPGLVDSVRDGESGILVPHGDATALADAILSVLTREELRQRLSRGGLAWAQRFTWERCADEAWEVARAAIARAPLPDFAPGGAVDLGASRSLDALPESSSHEGPRARPRSA